MQRCISVLVRMNVKKEREADMSLSSGVSLSRGRETSLFLLDVPQQSKGHLLDGAPLASGLGLGANTDGTGMLTLNVVTRIENLIV